MEIKKQVPWNKGLTKKTDNRILCGKNVARAAHSANAKIFAKRTKIYKKRFETNPKISIAKNGYKLISIPGLGSPIYHHIYVWEKYNGPLSKGRCVHHIDGNKQNNDIRNLQGMTIKEHISMHMRIRVYIDKIVPAPPNPKLKIDENKIIPLYNLGFSDRKIAKSLGISKSWVLQWRNRRKLSSNYFAFGKEPHKNNKHLIGRRPVRQGA